MRSTPLIAGAVVAHGGRVLLIRRTSPAGALLWTFPSGKVEPGESAAEAAAREAGEEAGIVVEPLVVLGSRVHPTTGWRVVYVACQLLAARHTRRARGRWRRWRGCRRRG